MNSAAYGCAQSHFRNCRMFDEATEELAAGLGVHFQKPLALAQGPIDTAEVGEVLLLCRRRGG